MLADRVRFNHPPFRTPNRKTGTHPFLPGCLVCEEHYCTDTGAAMSKDFPLPTTFPLTCGSDDRSGFACKPLKGVAARQ